MEVARYVRKDQAEDRGLVVLAMGRPYWIIPADGIFSLMVDADDLAAVTADLEKFEDEKRVEREQAQREFEEAQSSPPRRPVPKPSLFVFAWIMSLFFVLQAHFSSSSIHWMERGTANSVAIAQGEWWRTITALTLHADLAHLVANLAVGVIFAGALLPHIGTGWTWFGILLSGAAGNWLNAWGHRDPHELHLSIGASTAVFGGLGILVGLQVADAIRGRTAQGMSHRLVRRVWFPIAAGLALLAYLGSGTDAERVDFMAHLFGMLAGGVLGAALAWAQLPQRTAPGGQKCLAALALLLPCVAWALALHR